MKTLFKNFTHFIVTFFKLYSNKILNYTVIDLIQWLIVYAYCACLPKTSDLGGFKIENSPHIILGTLIIILYECNNFYMTTSLIALAVS